jgi:phosphoribosylaminoimidazole-succinocarboxamide synthase
MEKGELVIEGKTKKIFAVVGDENNAIIEYKNAITAFDDPSYTQEFATKAKHSNTTTCRVFEALKDAGVPVAYESQLSETEFLAPKCTMIPLEVVARRYAVGSYLKRHPELAKEEGEDPHRFDDLKVEFFLKTSSGGLTMGEKVLVEGLDPKAGEEDPFIENPEDATWKLKHPKKQASDDGSDLGKSVEASDVLLGDATVSAMRDITKRTFETIEGLWSVHEFKLIDFKIEFGVTNDGTLLVADVIDNDSWRLWPSGDKTRMLDKQIYRNLQTVTSADLAEIANRYAIVAELTGRLHIG